MLTVYGIPTCGTVKKARAWLDARSVPHTFVDFRKNPPSKPEVTKWINALGSGPMRNTSGGSYRALPAEKADWADAMWAEHFAADPMLIRRPLITGPSGPLMVGFRGTDDALAAVLDPK